MKTEWMYFMAGAGLMAAVMTLSSKEHSTFNECMVVEMQKMPSAQEDARQFVMLFCSQKYPGGFDNYVEVITNILKRRSN
jgi:hypothetical protein